jgi:hypothetical protein
VFDQLDDGRARRTGSTSSVAVSNHRARLIAAGLLVVAAALFGGGVISERNATDHHDASAETTQVQSERSEIGDHDEADQKTEATESSDDDKETFLGIDGESPLALAAVVAVSVGLAAGLALHSSRAVVIAALVVALVFAHFDAAEVLHQIDESNAGLARLAGAVAAAHLASTGASGVALRAHQ